MPRRRFFSSLFSCQVLLVEWGDFAGFSCLFSCDDCLFCFCSCWARAASAAFSSSSCLIFSARREFDFRWCSSSRFLTVSLPDWRRFLSFQGFMFRRKIRQVRLSLRVNEGLDGLPRWEHNWRVYCGDLGNSPCTWYTDSLTV